MADGMTSLTAFSKSLIVTISLLRTSGDSFSSSRLSSGRTRLRHFIAASLHRYSRSAPTKPCVTAATLSWSTSVSSGILRVCICNISKRPRLSGTLISISLSKRPGLLSAGSIAFGLFVAAITMTLPLASRPSISDSSCDTTLLSTSPVTSSLFGAIESISSMNMIEGDFSFASLNISLSLASDSP